MTHLPDPRRKRLLFRSWHRGTREADLILGSFADQHLADFDEAQLDRYEVLLDRPDPDIFDWLMAIGSGAIAFFRAVNVAAAVPARLA